MSGLRPVPDQTVTREQLAEQLGVSTDTVDRWREDGMPWHNWGRRLVRFRVREVTRWLDEQDNDHRKAA
jgi:excisionase family DNA binding protein